MTHVLTAFGACGLQRYHLSLAERLSRFIAPGLHKSGLYSPTGIAESRLIIRYQ